MSLFRLFVVMLVFSVSTHAGNLLKNPGFESGSQDWKIPNGKGPGPRYSIDKKVKRSGSSSLSWQSQKNSGYILGSQRVRLKTGRMYRLSAWIKTENLTGARESGATICMGYSDINKKYIKGGPHPGGIQGTTDWRQIIAYAGPIPKEVIGGGVVCYVRKGSKKSFAGKAWWDDVRLELVPFWCRILKPSYKMTFMDEKNTLEFEFETYPEDYRKKFKDLIISIKLSSADNKKVVFERKFVPKKRIERKTFTVGELLAGKYLLTTALKNKSGKQLWNSSHKLIKASKNYNPKVYIDKYGRTIANGKPFFPLGVYMRTAAWSMKGVNFPFPTQLNMLKDSGFNCIMPYDALSKSQMNACANDNIKVIYSVKNYFNKIRYSPKSIHSEADEVPQMLRVINRWKKHPALLAWYVNDELGPGVLNSLQAHYDAINAADPDHPSWNLHNKPQETTSMINTCDIIGIDEYPVPKHKLSMVTKAVKNTLKATRKSRALWAVPQIMNYQIYGMAHARPPTLVQLRNMGWQAICAGANGLIFYSFHDCLRDKKFPIAKTWPAIRQMSLEIKTYIPVLLSIEKKPRIKVKSPSWLKWTARVKDGILYVFAINNGDLSGNVRFSISKEIESVTRINLGKDKTEQKLENAKKSWSDKFTKHEVCIYTIKLK